METMENSGASYLPATADGPFEPNWESLQQYKCPDWFRDAKFGIWAHWGPQAVGEAGDWYAKFLYCPTGDWYGHNAYHRHIEMYGHPTTHGYKDILPLWKASKWNPERLMSLYKKAGAKYFMAMGCHHDNFDCWDSKFQPWNSKRIGPEKDIVGIWKQAADKEGLPLGVSFHPDYSWWWWQPCFWSDIEGSYAGIPYDGAQHLDGKGTWWDGLDLKDLYGIDLSDEYVEGLDPRKDFFHAVPETLKNTEYAEWYCAKWYNRVKDLIDNYAPELIYFDGGGNDWIPFSGKGTGRGIISDALPRITAHHYNTSIANNNGKLEAVMNIKTMKGNAIILDCESHFNDEILPEPWQNDCSFGEWFYEAGFYYSTDLVIHQLLEVVSRNGNLMLNMPLNADGELDLGGEMVLEELAKWFAVNGQGIYSTRPWKIYGEGTTRMPNGNLGKNNDIPFTGEDFRFMQKDGLLYAFCMTVPQEPVLIKSLGYEASLCDKPISAVKVLGSTANVKWTQIQQGLSIMPLENWPCRHSVAFEIMF